MRVFILLCAMGAFGAPALARSADERTAKLLETIASDHAGTRAKDAAMDELVRLYTPELDAELKAHYAATRDVDVRIRLERVLRQGPVTLLRGALSEKTTRLYPELAQLANSHYLDDQLKALQAAHGPAGLPDKRESLLVVQTILERLNSLSFDWTLLQEDYKTALLGVLADQEIPLDEASLENFAALAFDDSQCVSEDAILGLLQRKPNKKVQEASAAAFKEMESSDRVRLVKEIIGKKLADQAPLIHALWKEEQDKDVKRAYFYFLMEHLPREQAVEVALEALADPELGLEALSIDALAARGAATEHAGRIEPFLRSFNFNLRDSARRALGRDE